MVIAETEKNDGNVNLNFSETDSEGNNYTLGFCCKKPGHIAQSMVHLTQEPEIRGSRPGPAAYFHFPFR